MDTGILLGAAVGCAVGSILPWINSELVLLGAAAALPSGGLPTLVAVCVVSRMLAKSTLYGVTRWAPERLPRRAREALGRAERFRHRRRLLTAAVFLGSSLSLPPFYLVTLASGLVRVPFLLFAFAGALGTTVRYGGLVWLARLAGVA